MPSHLPHTWTPLRSMTGFVLSLDAGSYKGGSFRSQEEEQVELQPAGSLGGDSPGAQQPV